MLDIRYIEQNINTVKKACRTKRFEVDVDKILEINTARKQVLQVVEEIKKTKNAVSKKITSLSGEEKIKVLDEMKQLSETEKENDKKLKNLENEMDEMLLKIPNIPMDDVPEGRDEADNKEILKVGSIKKKKDFPYEFKDHVELGLSLDIMDFSHAASIAGSRSYYLKNEGVLLQMAIMRFAMDLLLKDGFAPFYPPFLVKVEAMEGTGYFPFGIEQAYAVEKDGLYLIGTSEVSLVSYHRDEIIDEDKLPLLYAGYSTCFRREAGTYGKDTKGLYRMHQFEKIEQVVICKNDIEESEKLHDKILENAKKILDLLELPYRVMYVCTGDLGLGQVKKHDIEVWMPSRDAYGETHSCSSFFDFQSRRSKIRVRDKNGKLYFPYTLNNTAIASPRILIPLLELHQQEDGSVKIPKVLHPYMNGKTQIQVK